jgi:cellulose synthase/poly-beta-1,6-N-acetylglucosamine synthase-like glycosyltransferase
MLIIFWLSLSFIIYTYFIYPLVINILAKYLRKISPSKEFENLPTATIVISIYNEINNLPNKLENLRALNYPNKLKFLFISDGSNDGSVKFLEQQNDVKVLAYAERRGKPAALNLALEHVDTKIVIFADVRQTIDEDACYTLVKRLLQKNIGAVSGELVLASKTNIGKNIGLYWRYEKWIRKAESNFHSVAGVTGALYAIRRKHFTKIPEDTLLDDFIVPINILKNNLRVVLAEDAKIYDNSQESNKGERTRKIRTLTGNYQAFMRNLWLFSPLKNPIFIQFISHKVFRLLVPYALLLLFFSSIFLNTIFYQTILILQILFYFCGFLGIIFNKLRKNKIISFIVVFISLNLAVMIALKNYLFTQVEVKWEKT